MGDAVGAIVGAMAVLLPVWLYLLIAPGPHEQVDVFGLVLAVFAALSVLAFFGGVSAGIGWVAMCGGACYAAAKRRAK